MTFIPSFELSSTRAYYRSYLERAIRLLHALDMLVKYPK